MPIFIDDCCELVVVYELLLVVSGLLLLLLLVVKCLVVGFLDRAPCIYIQYDNTEWACKKQKTL